MGDVPDGNLEEAVEVVMTSAAGERRTLRRRLEGMRAGEMEEEYEER